MSKVYTDKSLHTKNNKQPGGKKAINTLGEALVAKANCGPCGCDDCFGYETFISAETGELLIRYYTGPLGGPYVQVVDEFHAGKAAVDALYKARI